MANKFNKSFFRVKKHKKAKSYYKKKRKKRKKKKPMQDDKVIDLKAELCRMNFYYFVKTFWTVIIQEKPVWNWHIKYICDELQGMAKLVADRKPRLYDLIINVPPGSSKSTIVTIMYPAWCWLIDPSMRIMAASYSGGLSMDHSTKNRDVIRSELYKELFPEVVMRKDMDGKGRFKNTKGGERLATSVRGTVTGFHAHILLVDDPLNPKEASSEKERSNANRFMNETLSTRKVDKELTPTVLVMQRLHKEDCTGNWLRKKNKEIKHICLPAEISERVSPPELKERYIDGLLDPIRISRKALAILKSDLGSYGYAGQMGQSPAPDEGGIWEKWMVPISRYELSKLKLTSVGSDFDLAYTKNNRNSASAFITAGKHDNKMYITDLGFKWLEFPELIKWMKTLQSPHYIENLASGKSAKQTLTKNGIVAIEVSVTGGDKIARTSLSTPFAEAGMIYIAEDLIEILYHDSKQGILIFPNGEGDDLNDALTQSINRLLAKPKARVKQTGLL